MYNIDQENEAFENAIRRRAEVAEWVFAQNLPPTPTDITAVALAHPESYDIQVRAR